MIKIKSSLASPYGECGTSLLPVWGIRYSARGGTESSYLQSTNSKHKHRELTAYTQPLYTHSHHTTHTLYIHLLYTHSFQATGIPSTHHLAPHNLHAHPSTSTPRVSICSHHHLSPSHPSLYTCTPLSLTHPCRQQTHLSDTPSPYIYPYTSRSHTPSQYIP